MKPTAVWQTTYSQPTLMGRLNNMLFEVTLRRILTLILVLIFIWYLAFSSSKYFKRPLGISISEEEQNSFHFPSIVVCGPTPPNVTTASFEHKIIEKVEQMLEVEPGKAERVVFEAGNTDNAYSSPSWPIWETFFYPSAFHVIQCQMYSPPRKTPYGLQNIMRVFLNRDSAILFMLNHRDLFTPFTFFDTSAFTLIGSLANMRLSVDFGTKVRLHHENGWSCQEGNNNQTQQNMLQCYLNYIAAKVPCFKQNGTDTTDCTPEDEKRLKEASKEFDVIGETQFLSLTGCMVPCSLPTYDVRIQDISPGYQSNSNISRPPLEMMLYAPRGKMVVRSEYVIYDLGSLVGEVGGMAGILLGVSCIMVYDVIKVFIKRVFRIRNKKTADFVIERA